MLLILICFPPFLRVTALTGFSVSISWGEEKNKKKKEKKVRRREGLMASDSTDKPIDRWGEAGLHFIDYDLHDFG